MLLATVVGTVVATLAAASISLRLVILILPVAVVLATLTAVQRDGEPLAHTLLRWGRWWWG